MAAGGWGEGEAQDSSLSGPWHSWRQSLRDERTGAEDTVLPYMS